MTQLWITATYAAMGPFLLRTDISQTKHYRNRVTRRKGPIALPRR